MSDSRARSSFKRLAWYWPWVLLVLTIVPAVWHVLDFPSDVDPEAPTVYRPTFSRFAPAAYRLAETGDTIDWMAIDFASAAILLAGFGLFQRRKSGQGSGLWPAALALALAAFWHASTPGPSVDGWWGLGWRSIFDARAPWLPRLILAGAALGLLAVIATSTRTLRGTLSETWDEGRRRGIPGLLVAAANLFGLRQVEVPGLEPALYWPKLAWVCSLLALDLAMVRGLIPETAHALGPRPWLALGKCVLGLGIGTFLGLLLIKEGRWIDRYHQPIRRLKVVAPGKIYMSAMPTYEGLERLHRRHHLKTIINLFPEDTFERSPYLEDEIRFAREHGIRYLRSPSKPGETDAFFHETLALARDPNAWPILVHCHGGHDRTPAWVGIYRFLVEGRPLDEVMREMEQHRGARPKGSVTLLYNRILPTLAPERYALDPTADLLRRCESGVSLRDRQAPRR